MINIHDIPVIKITSFNDSLVERLSLKVNNSRKIRFRIESRKSKIKSILR